jgi:hypothetical protein
MYERKMKGIYADSKKGCPQIHLGVAGLGLKEGLYGKR